MIHTVLSVQDQNQVLKEVDLEKSLDDLYYDAFSGQMCVCVNVKISYEIGLCQGSGERAGW